MILDRTHNESMYLLTCTLYSLSFTVDFIGTIEAVNEKGMRVCAHPALQTELEVAW